VLTDFLSDLPVPRGLQPAPALFPADIPTGAGALAGEFATRAWATSSSGACSINAIRPSVWGEKGDRELVDRTLKEDVPTVLDYLEARRRRRFRFGGLSIADIAPACFFRNAGWVRFQIDAARWPRAAAWMARTLATPPSKRLAAIEDSVLRTPIAEQREKLKRSVHRSAPRPMRRPHRGAASCRSSVGAPHPVLCYGHVLGALLIG